MKIRCNCLTEVVGLMLRRDLDKALPIVTDVECTNAKPGRDAAMPLNNDPTLTDVPDQREAVPGNAKIALVPKFAGHRNAFKFIAKSGRQFRSLAHGLDTEGPGARLTISADVLGRSTGTRHRSQRDCGEYDRPHMCSHV